MYVLECLLSKIYHKRKENAAMFLDARRAIYAEMMSVFCQVKIRLGMNAASSQGLAARGDVRNLLRVINDP